MAMTLGQSGACTGVESTSESKSRNFVKLAPDDELLASLRSLERPQDNSHCIAIDNTEIRPVSGGDWRHVGFLLAVGFSA
jgi:hypothetical protein